MFTRSSWRGHMLLEELTDSGLDFPLILSLKIPHEEPQHKWCLTCGRGLTENQRLVWLLSMPL